MVSCPNRSCPVCGTPLGKRQKSACSGRCRAALSRQRKAHAQEDRDQRLQRLVETLAREVGLRVEDLG